MTTCPLCGYAFADKSREAQNACDHEAGWYRQWLAEAAAPDSNTLESR